MNEDVTDFLQKLSEKVTREQNRKQLEQLREVIFSSLFFLFKPQVCCPVFVVIYTLLKFIS